MTESFQIARLVKGDAISSKKELKMPLMGEVSSLGRNPGDIGLKDDKVYVRKADQTVMSLSSSSTLETGYIGLNFFGSQIIPTGSPDSVVQFNTDYSPVAPHPSFDVDTANYGFQINATGVYSISYDILISNSELTAAGGQARYQTTIQYPSGGVEGIRITGLDVEYGTTTANATPGDLTLKGNFVAYLTAGVLVVLHIAHNSKISESIFGPHAGISITFPYYFNSYMQIIKLS
jgi:hypothetical protein